MRTTMTADGERTYRLTNVEVEVHHDRQPLFDSNPIEPFAYEHFMEFDLSADIAKRRKPPSGLAEVRIEVEGIVLVGQAIGCQGQRLHVSGGRNWLTDAKTGEEIRFGNP